MLAQLFQRGFTAHPELSVSNLYSEATFYPVFLKDLRVCQSEVIISYLHRWPSSKTGDTGSKSAL
jgi:hypothetical protein